MDTPAERTADVRRVLLHGQCSAALSPFHRDFLVLLGRGLFCIASRSRIWPGFLPAASCTTETASAIAFFVFCSTHSSDSLFNRPRASSASFLSNVAALSHAQGAPKSEDFL